MSDDVGSKQAKEEEVAARPQFESAEFEAGSTPGPGTCSACGAPLGESYYGVNGSPVCPKCRDRLVAPPAAAARLRRLVKAMLFGVLGGLVGAGIYYAILTLTGYEIGLVAIVVGLLVGGGVRAGCEGRGGWLYQGLAILLTYAAIVSTYVPMVVKALREEVASAPAAAASEAGGVGSPSSPVSPESEGTSLAEVLNGDRLAPRIVAYALVFVMAFALPFLAGFDNLIGLLIIGFALYQAWKINKRAPIAITGPHQVAPAGPAGGDVPA